MTPEEEQLVKFRELAAEVVATWPPLSPEVRDPLRRLLTPVRHPQR
jgi:hypothetical protein